MSDQDAKRVLQNLYQIADAGEKGYATAAANMPNPALKIIFKLYAQQRKDFKTQIMDELHRLGGDTSIQPSIPGAIHRGRVAIFAGMAADEKGQASVILRETVLGERVAARTYQRALEKDLPEPTRALVQHQFEEIRRAAEQIHCLREDEKRRDSMQLSGSRQDTDLAVQSLVSSGFHPDEIETMDLDDKVLYEGRGATMFETVLSGAFGGALWGGLTGLLAGFGVVQTTDVTGFWPIAVTWLLTTLGFMLIGALISSVLAFFIGLNLVGEDNYHYPAIRDNAQVLVRPKVC